MSLLDEKITALFRRGSPIFNGAESAPSVDRPIAKKAASQTVVSESAIDEAIARKPKGHDFVIDRRHLKPALPRHMSMTGG